MPRYRVLAKSFINNAIVNEGDIVDYDGIPGANLEPYAPAAKARGKGAAATEPEAQSASSADVAAEAFEVHLT